MIGGMHHHLRLAGQPTESGGVNDPVPVPLEACSLVVGLFRNCPSAGTDGERRAGPQPLPLVLLASLSPDHRRRGRARLRGVGVRADETTIGVPGHGLRPQLRPGGGLLSHRRHRARPKRDRGRSRRCRRASGRAMPPDPADCPDDRAADQVRSSERGTRDPGGPADASSSAKDEMEARARRISPPTGKPLRYQAMCLRRSVKPMALVAQGGQQFTVATDGSRDFSQTSGRSSGGRPANASARSRNSHGRPGSRGRSTTPSALVRVDHGQGVRRLPNVAVAQHRDGDAAPSGERWRPSRRSLRSTGARSVRAARSRRSRPARRSALRPGTSDDHRRCRSGS